MGTRILVLGIFTLGIVLTLLVMRWRATSRTF